MEKGKLTDADKDVMCRIVLERATIGEEADWSELNSGHPKASHARVYQHDAAMDKLAQEIQEAVDIGVSLMR